MFFNPLGAVVIVVAGILLYRYAQRDDRAVSRTFRDDVLDDAAGWLRERLGLTAEATDRPLRDMVDHNRRSPALERVLRIEFKVEKLNSYECRRTVLVALAEPTGGAAMGQIARTVDWDDLPSKLRHDFIRCGSKVQTFLLFGRDTDTVSFQ